MENIMDSAREGGPALQLPAILDLKAAAPLAAALLARRGATITVMADEVRRLGGQCLQVLLSAAASWREDQSAIRFEAPSEEFLAALAHFGISREILFQQEDAAA